MLKTKICNVCGSSFVPDDDEDTCAECVNKEKQYNPEKKVYYIKNKKKEVKKHNANTKRRSKHLHT